MADRASPWTSEEVATAQRMKARGRKYRDIGAYLGRSKKSVELKFLYLRLSPEERRMRRGKKRLRSMTENRVRSIDRPNEMQIAERDERFGKPRTFAMLYLGDPLPGQSALDKRNMEVSHG